MPTTEERLVTVHEESAFVVTYTCDGPGCASLARRPDYFRQREGDAIVPPDEMLGWYGVFAIVPANEVWPDREWRFCSWDCVRAFMLGKPDPKGA